MPNNQDERKSGVGNIWSDNPYGGPLFLSLPNDPTGGYAGGAGVPLGGGRSVTSAASAGAASHHMDPVTMAALAQVIGSALGSAMAPPPYQQRLSFRGTGADPVSWMSDAKSSISNVLNDAYGRTSEPTGLEDLRVPDLGTWGHDLGLPTTSASPQRVKPTMPAGRAPLGAGASNSGTTVSPVRQMLENFAEQPGIFGNIARRGMANNVAPAFTDSGGAPDVGQGASTGVGSGASTPSLSQAHGAAQLLLHALTMPAQERQPARAA